MLVFLPSFGLLWLPLDVLALSIAIIRSTLSSVDTTRLEDADIEMIDVDASSKSRYRSLISNEYHDKHLN